MRSHLRVPRILGLIAVLASALALPMASVAQGASCADYSTTAAAQFALDINPGLAASLDPDGNGVACDNDANAQPTPSSTELQLPTESSGAAAPADAQPQQPTVDVVDQQPANATTTTTQPQQPAGDLDGRIGGSRAAFEAVHAQPIEELPSQNNPNTTGASYSPPATASELFVVFYTDQVAIVWLTPTQPWSSADAVGVIGGFVPADVTTLPQPEQLSDGSLMMIVSSPILASGVTQETMTAAGIPGVPGDMYLRLETDGSELITEVEIGIGNGDNVREDINSGATQTTPVTTPATTPTPVAQQQTTPTPVTTTTTTTTTTAPDTTIFLQQARTEVDQYQTEITELRTILGKDALTDADTSRLTEIVVGWMALDTTPMSAPPDQAAVAEQLTSVHADLSTVGGIVFSVMTTNDTSRIDEAVDSLNRAEGTLTTLDQQLTALGF
jgi:hypothetical protein